MHLGVVCQEKTPIARDAAVAALPPDAVDAFVDAVQRLVEQSVFRWALGGLRAVLADMPTTSLDDLIGAVATDPGAAGLTGSSPRRSTSTCGVGPRRRCSAMFVTRPTLISGN